MLLEEREQEIVGLKKLRSNLDHAKSNLEARVKELEHT